MKKKRILNYRDINSLHIRRLSFVIFMVLITYYSIIVFHFSWIIEFLNLLGLSLVLIYSLLVSTVVVTRFGAIALIRHRYNTPWLYSSIRIAFITLSIGLVFLLVGLSTKTISWTPLLFNSLGIFIYCNVSDAYQH